jgi:hypothetical protein
MGETADIRVGDIVSWEGHDAHEVLSVNGLADQFPVRVEVRCIRAAPGLLHADQEMPDPPWAEVGEVNWLESDEVDLISRE